jgi:hypothetical protein
MSYNLITYSDTHKSILWTPMKTGSSHATFMFTHFDFTTKGFDKETFELVNSQPPNKIVHHHNCFITDELMDYDVICTTRNPYARILSAFFYTYNMRNEELTVQNFRKFFAKEMEKPVMLYEAYFGYPKTPKYFLRMENLYEDYLKLPFVFESNIFQWGLLRDLCDMKINKGKNSIPTSEFFTMDMIDYFYDNFRNLFDINGYEKDSYKKYN